VAAAPYPAYGFKQMDKPNVLELLVAHLAQDAAGAVDAIPVTQRFRDPDKHNKRTF
jgi:hypothetical protein